MQLDQKERQLRESLIGNLENIEREIGLITQEVENELNCFGGVYATKAMENLEQKIRQTIRGLNSF